MKDSTVALLLTVLDLTLLQWTSLWKVRERERERGKEGERERVEIERGLVVTTLFFIALGPPLAPSKPIASHSTTTSVKLKWSPPEHDGHNPITSYLVEQLQNGFEDWRPIVQQLKTTFTVKTLDPNTWYQFRIIACNEQGSSEPSPPSEKVYTIKSKGERERGRGREEREGEKQGHEMKTCFNDFFNFIVLHTGWMSPVTKRRFLLDTESGKGLLRNCHFTSLLCFSLFLQMRLT